MGSHSVDDLVWTVAHVMAHTLDTKQALRDILTIKDFDRFLAASGYDGGAAPARVVEA
jgi:hypothetical protein